MVEPSNEFFSLMTMATHFFIPLLFLDMEEKYINGSKFQTDQKNYCSAFLSHRSTDRKAPPKLLVLTSAFLLSLCRIHCQRQTAESNERSAQTHRCRVKGAYKHIYIFSVIKQWINMEINYVPFGNLSFSVVVPRKHCTD